MKIVMDAPVGAARGAAPDRGTDATAGIAIRIGELAKQFGLNPKTIRYYEAIGLLPLPTRTAAGYRQYGEDAVRLVGFIQRAKLLGLSLAEIRAILFAQEGGEQPCNHVLTLIDAQVARIERRITALQQFRTDLGALRATWSDAATRGGERGSLCPIIEEQTAVDERPIGAHALDLVAAR